MKVNPVRLQNPEAPIIMVDDSSDDRNTARRCHERSHLKNPLRFFESGEAYLEFLEKVAQGAEPVPVMVLLDIRMPGLDGFEVLERMRSREPFQEVPVVMMLTNSDYQRDCEKALALGANAYTEKPSRISEYVDFFNSLAAEAD